MKNHSTPLAPTLDICKVTVSGKWYHFESRTNTTTVKEDAFTIMPRISYRPFEVRKMNLISVGFERSEQKNGIDIAV